MAKISANSQGRILRGTRLAESYVVSYTLTSDEIAEILARPSTDPARIAYLSRPQASDAVDPAPDSIEKVQLAPALREEIDDKVSYDDLPEIGPVPTPVFPANGQIDLSKPLTSYQEKPVMSAITVTAAPGAIAEGSANFRFKVFQGGSATFGSGFVKLNGGQDGSEPDPDVNEPGWIYAGSVWFQEPYYIYVARKLLSFDALPPSFVSGSTENASPGQATLLFAENVTTSTAVPADITLTTNAGGRTVTTLNKSGSTFVLGLSSPLTAGPAVGFSIATGKVSDGAGNTNQNPITGTITNNVAPAVVPSIAIGSFTPTTDGQAVNLTAIGAVDYLYWINATSTRHKATGGNRVSQLTYFDAANPTGGAASITTSQGVNFSVTDSNDGAVTQENKPGGRVNSDNGPMGEFFTVLVKDNLCVIRVYLGILNGGTGTVVAELVDGGASAQTATYSAASAYVDITARGSVATSLLKITLKETTVGSSGFKNPILQGVAIMSEVA